jgi:hypothetical protein
MGLKRRPSAHQRQMRFFAILFGAIMIAVLVALILIFNQPPGGYH